MPRQTKTITITAWKGGVAKTTTAQAIAFCAAKQGQHTLLIDMDGQGNLTTACGYSNGPGGAYDFLARGAGAEIRTITKTLSIITAQDDLSGAERTLTGQGATQHLAQALGPISGAYDLIVIDTPPALGTLTLNALMASQWAIIPAMADIFSLEGVRKTIGVIFAAQERNPGLRAGGVLITRYQPRLRLAQPAIGAITQAAQAEGVPVFATRIRETAAIREAQGYIKDILAYNRRENNAANDYKAFWRELKRTIKSN